MTEDTELIQWDSIKATIVNFKDIILMAKLDYSLEAIQKWAKQSRQSLETQNEIAEYRLRLNRKQGEWIEANIPEDGGKPSLDDAYQLNSVSKRPILADVGIDRNDSPKFRILAEIPEEKFEQFIAETKSAAEELTSRSALAIGLKLRRQAQIRNVPDLPLGKYQVIYADPPWAYDNTGLGGSAESHYPTMSTDELAQLDISSRAGDDAVLFLWVTSPFLPEGLELCRAWGFEYKTTFIWIKDRSTYGKLGFYNYGQHEFLFVATRGSCLPQPGTLEPSVLFAPKRQHSEKPEAMYKLIERMYPGPYIELFARKTRPNWATWGTL